MIPCIRRTSRVITSVLGGGHYVSCADRGTGASPELLGLLLRSGAGGLATLLADRDSTSDDKRQSMIEGFCQRIYIYWSQGFIRFPIKCLVMDHQTPGINELTMTNRVDFVCIFIDSLYVLNTEMP